MNRVDILKLAADITGNYRNEEYGTPSANGKMIAQLWSAYFGFDVRPHDVWNCMALLKISRTKKSPQKLDTYADGAAYMAMAAEVAGAKEPDPVQYVLDTIKALPEIDRQRIREVLE